MGCSSQIQMFNPFEDSQYSYNIMFSNIEILLRENEEFKNDYNDLITSTSEELNSKQPDNKLEVFFTKHFTNLTKNGFNNKNDIKNLVTNQKVINFILESQSINFCYRKSVGFLKRIIETCTNLSPSKKQIIYDFLVTHTKDFPYEQIGPELNLDVLYENDIKFDLLIKNMLYNQRLQNMQFLHLKITKNFCMDLNHFYDIVKLIDSQIYLLTVVIEISFEETITNGGAFVLKNKEESLLANLTLILKRIEYHRTIKSFVFMCRDALKCNLTDEIYVCLRRIMTKHNMIAIHFRNIYLNNEILEGFINSNSRYVGLENSEPDKDLFQKLATAVMKHTKIIFCLLTGFGIDPMDVTLFEKKIYSEK